LSGHSKWANIKRKKGIKDQEKAKIFTKLSRLITLAVIEGGKIPDPEKNVKLRLIVEKAKANNMPKENIERAIDRAISTDVSSLKELVYEGFGPYGSMFVIVATTDNSNRTYNDIRTIIEKAGGKVGASGSVLYNFNRCSVAVYKKTEQTEESIMKIVDELEATDFEETEDEYVIYCAFEKLGSAKQLAPYYRPLTTISLDSEDQEGEIISLINNIEELDDVQNVYVNLKDYFNV
jgi:YebC/PmpR family DNA-binding regulatory protein